MNEVLKAAAQSEPAELVGLRPLPDEVVDLLAAVAAPPRLGAHLRLVYDVAVQITYWMRSIWPVVLFDAELVAFGAATHDIGKALHPNELIGPGHAHEVAGQAHLTSHGVPQSRARFAVTHNAWQDETAELEDLLVAVADKVWKGRRGEDLEQRLVNHKGAVAGREAWQVFAELDHEL